MSRGTESVQAKDGCLESQVKDESLQSSVKDDCLKSQAKDECLESPAKDECLKSPAKDEYLESQAKDGCLESQAKYGCLDSYHGYFVNDECLGCAPTMPCFSLSNVLHEARDKNSLRKILRRPHEEFVSRLCTNDALLLTLQYSALGRANVCGECHGDLIKKKSQCCGL